MIEEKSFGKARLYTLSNAVLQVRISSRGATVTSLRYRGQETILGYDSDEGYLRGGAYLGATVGRVGNRIGGAAFTLNGQRYDLVPNEGPNQLHGGPEAFDRQLWEAERLDDTALRFTLFSPDGENGFPGNLEAAVTYRLNGGTLRIEFAGKCDKDTVYAPTNHMYFDLSGKGEALEARLWLGADAYVEPGEGLIPTGRLLPCEGAFDFHSLRKVAREYDHAFVLSGEHACRLEDGGLRMDLFTDMPGLQVYTGRYLPNQPAFPSIELKAGEPFLRWAEYRFTEI